MIRAFVAAVVSIVLCSQVTYAQDGPLNRAGRALDNAGRNIRNRVETEVERGQISAQERDVLHRVVRRIEWDKQLVGSVLQIESQPGGVVYLRGSVLNDVAKKRAMDLAENTLGVSKVVSELALVKDVKVVESVPTQVIVTPVETRVVAPPAVVPSQPRVIVKP